MAESLTVQIQRCHQSRKGVFVLPMTAVFPAALLWLNLDFKSDATYTDTQLLDGGKEKSKGFITDPNFPGLLDNSV